MKEIARADLLARHENTIKEGLTTFVSVGNALAAIRDERLYRESHSTFEAYCQERWNLSRKRSYDLMSGAEAVNRLSPIGDIPEIENEAQAREIAKILKAEGVERAAEVLTRISSAGEKITAKSISDGAAEGEPWMTPQQARDALAQVEVKRQQPTPTTYRMSSSIAELRERFERDADWNCALSVLSRCLRVEIFAAENGLVPEEGCYERAVERTFTELTRPRLDEWEA